MYTNLIRSLASQRLLCLLNVQSITSPFVRKQFEDAIARVRTENQTALPSSLLARPNLKETKCL